MNPPVMVLDEPTSQLDPQGTREVMETIEKLAAQGRTIVLVEHKLEWVARLASRVLVLDQGTLVAEGDARAVLSRAQEWGLNETRFARAARLAMERGLIAKAATLPQTLEQARATFAPAKRSDNS
jgi:energy-coupling factor transporter ATP-binding protein EcfA2